MNERTQLSCKQYSKALLYINSKGQEMVSTFLMLAAEALRASMLLKVSWEQAI